MNLIILSGRITKDAELNYLPGAGTPKATFTIAVDRNFQKDKNNKKVDFINCEMLGKGAEALHKYLEKGKAIHVNGELNIENYEKNGEKKSFVKVKVDRVEFQQGGNAPTNNTTKDSKGFEAVEINEDEIPF